MRSDIPHEPLPPPPGPRVRRQAVRVALIGAGKFGSMFLAQVPHTPGLEVPIIADIDATVRAKPAAPWAGTPSASRPPLTDDGGRAIAGGAM